jgi:hypothetical protein
MDVERLSASPRRADLAALGIALLRVGFGLVFLTNGIAKLTGWDGIHPFPGFLIDLDGARGILAHDVQTHPVAPYKRVIDDVVLANWGLFPPGLGRTRTDQGGLACPIPNRSQLPTVVQRTPRWAT